MSGAPELAIVVSPRDWAEVLHRWVADHGGALVRARIVGPQDAIEEGYDVLVVEDLTSFLSPRLVEDVRRLGRQVLGVYDPAEPWGRARLEELGVDDVLPSTTSPEEIVQAVRALVAVRSIGWDLHPIDVGVPGGSDGARRSPLVVVGGPGGGCGRTEVAVGLTDAFARHGRSAVLVDADDVAPSVAQRLGLPLHPNLRTAIDVIEHGGGDLGAALRQIAPGVDVLVGLPSPRDWRQVRPREVAATVSALRDGPRDVVIADVGPVIEEVPAGHGAERFGITRAMLGRATAIVAVCAPTPVGVARLLSWVSQVGGMAPSVPVHGVVNAVPRGRFVRGELSEELWRAWPLSSVGFVPMDGRVRDAAWRGCLVGGGGFQRALDGLVAALDHEAWTRAPESVAVGS